MSFKKEKIKFCYFPFFLFWLYLIIHIFDLGWRKQAVPFLLELFVYKATPSCLTKVNGVYQSDTAGVKIPELDLELASGTLGGVVTTVEGLITKISESEYHFSSLFSLSLCFSWAHA